MKNIVDMFYEARSTKVFKSGEFEQLLQKLLEDDSELKLDWDDSVGEEWARFFHPVHGIVCMINSKIGIAFVRTSYNILKIKEHISHLYTIYTNNFDTEEWYVDLTELKHKIPEIYWHTAEDAVNSSSFSLSEMYFATI